MAKKEKIEETKEIEKKCINREQYWEWRTTIAEMNTAKEAHKNSVLDLKLMQKEAEIMSIRSQLFLKTTVEAKKEDFETASKEYDRFKKVIEDSIGTSLNGKMIDDVTLEVKDLPDKT